MAISLRQTERTDRTDRADRTWHHLCRYSLRAADALAAPFRWLRGRLAGPWVAPDPTELPTDRPHHASVAGAIHGDPSYLEVWDVTGPSPPTCVGACVDLDDAMALADWQGPGRYRMRTQAAGRLPGQFVGPVILRTAAGLN